MTSQIAMMRRVALVARQSSLRSACAQQHTQAAAQYARCCCPKGCCEPKLAADRAAVGAHTDVPRMSPVISNSVKDFGLQRDQGNKRVHPAHQPETV